MDVQERWKLERIAQKIDWAEAIDLFKTCFEQMYAFHAEGSRFESGFRSLFGSLAERTIALVRGDLRSRLIRRFESYSYHKRVLEKKDEWNSILDVTALLAKGAVCKMEFIDSRQHCFTFSVTQIKMCTWWPTMHMDNIELEHWLLDDKGNSVILLSSLVIWK